MPNERLDIPTWIENGLELPRCCPVTGNPQPGSRIGIRYRAGGRVLEVFALKQYIGQFVGGHPDGTRNMETMIQQIAQDCAQALGTKVKVRAELVLMPYQQMTITCTARADDFLPGDTPSELAGENGGSPVHLAAAPGEPEAAPEGDL